MIEMFLAGFLGVVVGVAATAFFLFQLYEKEKQMAQEFGNKFFSALSQADQPKKKKDPVDFLSLIKSDKDTPIN